MLRVTLAALSVAGIVTVRYVVGHPRRQRSNLQESIAWIAPGGGLAESSAILRLLFTEAIAVYGVLLFTLGGHLADLLGFSGASLAVFAWYVPTRARWNRELQAGRSVT